MVTERKFAHFKRNIFPPRMKDIPEGGFCISSFVIIMKTGNPNHILMGRLNKKADWNHLGALDPERVQSFGKGWMIPSSGLMLGESPQDAAQRVLKEQLGLVDQKLKAPLVFSEVYGPMKHWALEFLFIGERDQPPSNEAWTELAFVDLGLKTSRPEIARLHEDILAHLHKWDS